VKRCPAGPPRIKRDRGRRTANRGFAAPDGTALPRRDIDDAPPPDLRVARAAGPPSASSSGVYSSIAPPAWFIGLLIRLHVSLLPSARRARHSARVTAWPSTFRSRPPAPADLLVREASTSCRTRHHALMVRQARRALEVDRGVMGRGGLEARMSSGSSTVASPQNGVAAHGRPGCRSWSTGRRRASPRNVDPRQADLGLLKRVLAIRSRGRPSSAGSECSRRMAAYGARNAARRRPEPVQQEPVRQPIHQRSRDHADCVPPGEKVTGERESRSGTRAAPGRRRTACRDVWAWSGRVEDDDLVGDVRRACARRPRRLRANAVARHEPAASAVVGSPPDAHCSGVHDQRARAAGWSSCFSQSRRPRRRRAEAVAAEEESATASGDDDVTLPRGSARILDRARLEPGVLGSREPTARSGGGRRRTRGGSAARAARGPAPGPVAGAHIVTVPGARARNARRDRGHRSDPGDRDLIESMTASGARSRREQRSAWTVGRPEAAGCRSSRSP
jgi:hypothetical protein